MSIACARGTERYFLLFSAVRLRPRLAFGGGWAKFIRNPPYELDPA
jgi:hypothetical protein